MNDKTDNLKKAFKYVRQFYNDISIMMSDVIESMARKDWSIPDNESPVTSDLSKKLDNPDYWMTYYIYKNFKNEKIDNHVKGILIFFDEYLNDFPLGIVCGNIYASSDHYDKWNLWSIYNQNKDKLRALSGDIISLTAANKDKGIEVNAKIFAIPAKSGLTRTPNPV